MEYKSHYSVFGREVLDFFSSDKEGEKLFADLTLGAAGHTRSILENIINSKVIAFDQDPEAVANANNTLSEDLKQRLIICDENFSTFTKQEATSGKLFDGILIDLGVSSHHFDSPERGFSFRFDGPLDMRMNTRGESITAADFLAEYDDESLESILYDYGEERFAKQIVQAIRKHQLEVGPVTRTKELEDIVFHAYPKKLRFGRKHPATQTFQALRIAVNRELDVITETVPRLFDYLVEGGKLAIISFHSLEDRIVKNIFRDSSKERNDIRVITKRPLVPKDDEIAENSRSRSAKLRVVEKKTKTN